MKMTKLFKLLSLCFCFVLIAAMALNLCSCSNDAPDSSSVPTVSDEATVIGEGSTEFTFKVTANGKTKTYTVKTDKTVVGDALLELELISGEEGQYGLYVKTVDGVTADYDVDGSYWAFYIDGEYAMSGVDATDIVAGTTYEFKVEK